MRPAILEGYWGDPEALDTHGRGQLVLRTLTEEFGGETRVSALGRHLSQGSDRTSLRLAPWLFHILQDLECCGALALEVSGESDVIIRLLPRGAEIAYEPPAGRSVPRRSRGA